MSKIGRPQTITSRPTPAEARKLQDEGRYQADRHKPIIRWDDVAGRPTRKKPTKTKRKLDRKWIKNAADERAWEEGCWFDEAQANYVAGWFPRHLRHCEGSHWSGKPFDLLEWQRADIVYPLFGWQREDDLGRIVRRHRWTFIEVPKKNGKSTLASGIGLYMLVGEQEPGVEVYSYGVDRDSASIVHGYAIQLVEASELLEWFLDINRTTKHIKNNKHGLRYRAESSRPAASQGQKGKCAIVDELHAWYGQELWDSVRRIGYMWGDRLLFAITTAGDDEEHISFKVEEYAKAVLSGKLYDRELLGCIYQAQPGEDLLDPVVQKRVNPSLGEILSREDLVEEIDRSEAIPRERMSMRRYRFNIWAQPSAPWLDTKSWDECESALPDEELMTFQCVAGLDLARKWDLTAFAMVFIDQHDHYHVRAHAWLPRPRAIQLRKHVDYEGWEREGWLTLTDDTITDYDMVEQGIVEMVNKFNILNVAFDEKYATELMKRVADQTDITRTEFGQSMTNFAGPTAKLEQAIVGKQINHDGNKLLRWQIGNVSVRPDYDNNIRPVRPKANDHRTIDTVVALVMGLAVANEQTVDGYYENHALEFV